MPFKTRLARSRRSPPGFIRPCQPTLSAKAPAGAAWIHEVKHDGYRALARIEVGEARLWSRHGTPMGDRFPKIVEALRELEVSGAVIDGEVVCQTPDGRGDLYALRSKDGCRRAVLIAYDLIWLDGTDLRLEPLSARRKALAGLLASRPRGPICFSEHLVGDGEQIFRHVCDLGLEGIVSKRSASIYRSGPSPDWVKRKNPSYKGG
jgi:bifunctional non-homologous end joining protein LigD